MKDASTAIRDAYLTALADIMVNSELVPVYDTQVNDTIAPYTRRNPPKNYIILSNQTFTDRSPKCGFQTNQTMQVMCMTTFPAYSGNRSLSEQINSIVCQRVMVDRQTDLALVGFSNLETRVDLSRNQEEFTKDQNIFSKITIFSHIIQEI
jgi:hypothetical protein